MALLRGWWQKGEGLEAFAPHGCLRTLTFLGALRTSGYTAPCILDGPRNREAFFAWVDQLLVSTLMPWDSVVMDKLGSHERGEVRR